ncbi:MAG: hypothetical protein ACRBN8_40975 [Nannocystales bacterium]
MSNTPPTTPEESASPVDDVSADPVLELAPDSVELVFADPEVLPSSGDVSLALAEPAALPPLPSEPPAGAIPVLELSKEAAAPVVDGPETPADPETA